MLRKRGLICVSALGAVYGIHGCRVRREYNGMEKPPLPFVKYLAMRTLPLRCMSSAAGSVASLRIPESLRAPLFSLYAKWYGCDVKECEDLSSFSNFQEFFSRRLLSGSRRFDTKSALCSPCDGTIIGSGLIKDPSDFIFEPIKGIRYNLEGMLGSTAFAEFNSHPDSSILGRLWPFKSRQKHLHYMTIYLAPGDYHRFHSPADMQIEHVERVHGLKAPVAPAFIRNVLPQTLAINERAVIVATENSGNKVAIVPVGSLNVSSIQLEVEETGAEARQMKRGSELGHFRMGSTIVLLYWSDGRKLRWTDQKHIRAGEPLLHY